MNRGWWVFGAGGLFTLKAVEDPPLAHIVNVPGFPAGPTLCGLGRFGPDDPGGAWGPSLDHLGGDSKMRSAQPCRACVSVLTRGGTAMIHTDPGERP